MAAYDWNHYVPEYYFEPWCGADSKMAYFTREAGKLIQRRTSPRSAAREFQLNHIEGAPDDVRLGLETEYFTPEIDEPAAPVLKKLERDGLSALSDDDRRVWVRFLRAALVRKPEGIASAVQIGKASLLQSLRDSPEDYEAMRPEGAPEKLEDFLKPWAIDQFGKLSLHNFIEKVDEVVAMMNGIWGVYLAPASRYQLLTADRPLVWNASPISDHFYLALPLSPHKIFLMTRTKRVLDLLYHPDQTKMVRRMNESVVDQAVKFVYSENHSQARFVGNRLRK
jgi:hypothetical protein